MKIVDRDTFLAMPPETLFCKYAPCYMEELQIKGRSLGEPLVDYFYQDIADAVWAEGISNPQDAFFKMEAGESVPLNFDMQGRDGCFDADQLFAVFEKPDVEALIERLKRCL